MTRGGQGERGATRIRVPDGVNLNVRITGAGRPTLVMIHGFGDGEFVWNSVLPSLIAYGSIATVDLRGHGESDRALPSSYMLESYVADVQHAIRILDLNSIAMIGHSLGAAVALCVAAKSPSLVRRLALIEGGPQLDVAAGSHIRNEFASQPWKYTSIEAYARRIATKLPMASSEVLYEFARHALRAHPEGGFELKCDRALANGPRSTDDQFLWSLLRTVRCPTLLVRGEASAVLTLMTARRIVGELSRGRFETVPLAGHAILLDNPVTVAAGLARFMEDSA